MIRPSCIFCGAMLTVSRMNRMYMSYSWNRDSEWSNGWARTEDMTVFAQSWRGSTDNGMPVVWHPEVNT